MRCDEVQEHISASYDGEPLPLQAQEHMARCAGCKEVWQEYAAAGAALRHYGDVLKAEPLAAGAWLTSGHNNSPHWWEKGLQMMRIPRIAFASLVLLLVAVASRLVLVEVRAHEDGSVLMLKLTSAQGEVSSCNIAIAGTDDGSCGGLWQTNNSNLLYAVRALRKEGGRVLLSLRAKTTPLGPASFGPETEATLPETQQWFTPGETLSVPNTGALKLTLTGNWSDHIPLGWGSNVLLDPGPNEIRLTSPLLLKNNQVAGDLQSIAIADKPGEGVLLYIPGEGRFLLSSTPAGSGSVEATIQVNRISFQSHGQTYLLVTGTPVTRSKTLWVLHDPNFRPASDSTGQSYISAGPVGKLL